MKWVLLLSRHSSILLFCASCPFAQAQISQDTVHLSRPSTWQQTELPISSITGDTVCHSSTSFYLRPFLQGQSFTKAPIKILRPDGQSTLIDLSVAATPPQTVLAKAFNTDVKGNLYVTLQIGSSSQWQIASFNKDGKFLSKTALSERLTPSFILPTSSGRFVIGGMKPRNSDEESHETSLIAIFDGDGHVVKSLSLPDDDAEEEVTKLTYSKYTVYEVSNRKIQMGFAASDAKGNIYVFRPSVKPTVQVTDSDGSTLRVLTLDPPTSDTWPSNFYLYDDAIAVGYFVSKQNGVCLVEGHLTLYSRDTGKRLGDYLVPLAPNVFLCSFDHSLVYLNAAKAQKFYELGSLRLPLESRAVR